MSLTLSEYGDKAQGKISEITDEIVDNLKKGFPVRDLIKQVAELLDFHESLLGILSPWTETERAPYMEFFIDKYDLVDVPVILDVYDLSTPITVLQASGSGITQVDLDALQALLEAADSSLDGRITTLEGAGYLTSIPTSITDDIAQLQSDISNLEAQADATEATADATAASYTSHAANTSIHVTPTDKSNWNAKVDSSTLTTGLANKSDIGHGHGADEITYGAGTVEEALNTLGSPPAGPTGATPNLTIGTVDTVDEDDPATVTITGTAEDPVLNFEIPRGLPWRPDASGSAADRSTYAGEDAGFVFQDNDNGIVYFKLVDGTDTWSNPFTVQGDNGWTPVMRLAAKGGGFYAWQLYDYTGGEGIKPTLNVGLYLAGDGTYVNDINLAANANGPAGAKPVVGVDYIQPYFKIDDTIDYTTYTSTQAALLASENPGYTVLIDHNGNPNDGYVFIIALETDLITKVWTGPFQFQGDTGATGAAGPQGSYIYSITGVPSSGLGVNGDWAFATDTQTLYGPKAGGAWSAGTALVGFSGSFILDDPDTSNPLQIASFDRTTSGTAADGIGSYISMGVEDDGGTVRDLDIYHILEDATGTPRSVFRVDGWNSTTPVTLLEINAGNEGRVNLGRQAGNSSGTINSLGISIGFQANGSTFDIGSNSIAIGTLAFSEGNFTVAVGGEAAARSQFGVSLGYSAEVGASSDYGIAIGYDAIAQAQDVISIGRLAGSSPGSVGTYSISIGSSSNNTFNVGGDSIAIGREAAAAVDGSVVVGAFSSSLSSNAISMGFGSSISASSDEGVAIGYGASVTAIGAQAFGSNSRGAAQGAIMMGYHSITQINSLSDSFEVAFDGSRVFKTGLTLGTQITVNADPATNLTAVENGSLAYDSTDHEIQAYINGAWATLESVGPAPDLDAVLESGSTASISTDVNITAPNFFINVSDGDSLTINAADPVSINSTSSTPTSIRTIFNLAHLNSGSVSAGFALRQGFILENSTGGTPTAAYLEALWDDPTNGSESTVFRISVLGNGSPVNLISVGGLDQSFSGPAGFVISPTTGMRVPTNADPDTNLTDATNGSLVYDSTDHEFRAIVNGSWTEVLSSIPDLDAVLEIGASAEINEVLHPDGFIQMRSRDTDLYGNINISSGGVVILNEDEGSGDITAIDISRGTASRWYKTESGNSYEINMGGNTGITVTDAVDTVGLSYADDYSSSNGSNPRWIPDKEYVDILAGAYTEITLTSSQILALNSTPITLIAAPGANNSIILDRVVADLPYNSATYAGNDIDIEYSGGASLVSFSSFLTSGADARQVRIQGDFDPVLNEAVVATVASADPTTGDSDVRLRIWYRIVDFS